MFEAAGSFAPILLGLGGLGALLALVFTGLGLTGRRVPLVAWLFAPLLTIVAGSVGSLVAVGEVATTLAGGVPSVFDAANSGLAEALGPRWLAHLIVAVLCAISAWGAGLGALLKPGGETAATPFAAVVGGLLSLAGAAGMGVYAVVHDLGSQAFLLVGLVAFAGLGASLAALRRGLHEAADRIASLRFVSGLMVVFAAAHGARALTLQGRMDVLRSHQGVDFPGLAESTLAAVAHAGDLTILAWGVFAIGFLVGIVAFVNELGEVVTRFTIVDVSVALVLLAVVGGVRFVESSAEYAMSSTGRLDPIPTLIADLSFQLPSATVSGWTTTFDVHVEGEAFGDIYRFGPDPRWTPPPQEELPEGAVPPSAPLIWYRAYAWTGAGWIPDDTPMRETTPDPVYDALLVAPGSTDARSLLDALDFVGGKAQVLLRANELDTMIPREVAFTEGHWMTLEVSDGVDFENEVYAFTDRFDIYRGVARHYGLGADAEKPIHRLDAVFDLEDHLLPSQAEAMGEIPEIDTVRAAIGERTRLDHIAALCLASKFDPADQPEEDDVEEPPTRREGTTCTIVDQDIDTLIAQAVDTLGMPDPDRLTARVTVEDDLDELPDGVEAAFLRELDAMAWCAPAVQDDMGLERPITGRLAGTFPIDERGNAGYIEWEDRNVIDIYDMRRCVKERIDRIRFGTWERELPEPELDEDGNEIEVEEPPMPKMSFTLTYR